MQSLYFILLSRVIIIIYKKIFAGDAAVVASFDFHFKRIHISFRRNWKQKHHTASKAGQEIYKKKQQQLEINERKNKNTQKRTVKENQNTGKWE